MKITRVLIVDDSVDSADSLAIFFELEGYEVRVARDGAEGVEAAVEFRPDLILMDLRMPRMDGFEAAREIGIKLADAKPRMVALTGLAREEDRPKLEEVGFEQALVKPVSPDQIRALLAE